ncbi:hypothetical protein TNCV_1449171 [Trichonephila clavipes]|nr:hypothetical protein TNCV_1449171 [Trichonephila clavipes]
MKSTQNPRNRTTPRKEFMRNIAPKTLPLNVMSLRRTSPKELFSVREQMTSQRSRSFTWESIQDLTLRLLRSKASQSLTSLHRADRDVTGGVSTLISGFKVHRVRGDKDH